MKWIKKVLFGIIITMATIVIGIYLWLNLRLDNVINQKEYKSLVDSINSSQDLPENFYTQYNLVYNVTSTNKKILDKLTNNSESECPCLNVVYEMKPNPPNNFTISLALDRDVKQNKCLDYYLNHLDFDYNTYGIRNASQFYYNKKIENLTEEEMLELAIMTKNPSYYNKKNHPELLEKAVDEIKNIKNN